MYVYISAWGGGRRGDGHGYPSLSLSLPTSSLWTAAGGGGQGGHWRRERCFPKHSS